VTKLTDVFRGQSAAVKGSVTVLL